MQPVNVQNSIARMGFSRIRDKVNGSARPIAVAGGLKGA